jgi:hypothetical protein
MNDFSWVIARSKCSARDVFEKLRTQVEKDIDIRHDLKPQGQPYSFRFVSGGSDKFTASVDGNKLHHSVIFTLKDDAINVFDEDDHLLFRAEVTLNHEGNCVVRINDQECELWYMRKMALEKLFFTEWIRGGDFYDKSA